MRRAECAAGRDDHMSFVWFDLRTDKAEAAREFYSSLLGWNVVDGGMFQNGDRPFAGVSEGAPVGDTPRWVPFVQVDDVDSATERARELGATVLQEKTSGPAGEYSTVTDPSGAAIALWQPASA